MCMMRQIEPRSAYLRLLHAAPLTGRVDVYANGNPIAGNLVYRGFSPYVKLPPGRYNITVYPAGATVGPIISSVLELRPGSIYTAAIIGRTPDVELYTVPDIRVPIPSGMANVRFVHLSPGAPAVDVTLPDGRILFSNISYKGITGYIPLAPGRYTIQLRLAGTNTVVLTVPNIVLRPARNYSLYAIGLPEGKPGLQLLIPLDGSTYLT